MKRAIGWLHCPSMTMLVVAAVLLGIMPVTPQPHLLEKIGMLIDGTLSRPVDIFDLFWHGWPLLWIALRLATTNSGASCHLPSQR